MGIHGVISHEAYGGNRTRPDQVEAMSCSRHIFLTFVKMANFNTHTNYFTPRKIVACQQCFDSFALKGKLSLLYHVFPCHQKPRPGRSAWAFIQSKPGQSPSLSRRRWLGLARPICKKSRNCKFRTSGGFSKFGN
jgi:hypothetical protein